MAHDDDIDPAADGGEPTVDALEQVENDDKALQLDAYDLDHDGKFSVVEDAAPISGSSMHGSRSSPRSRA